MFIRLSTARVGIGLAGTLFLAGCVAFPLTVAPSDPPPLPAQSRPKPSSPSAAPELRISGEAVAKSSDIPIVPVPPIPLGSGAARTTVPPVQPEIKQVSTLPPPSGPAIEITPGPLPPLTPPSVSTSPAEPKRLELVKDTGDLKKVAKEASDAYRPIDSYIARLTRREMVNGKSKPEEVLLFKFRTQPWSVYFKWLGKEGQGREVLYVKGQYENKIHSLLAAGDIPFTAAGTRMALATDSFLVKSASRHSITEAGMGASIERFASLLAAQERGDKTSGVLEDLGVQNRADYVTPLRLVNHVIPPGQEEELPRGGKRLYGFDTETHLPVLIVTTDDKGQEAEYYRYDYLQLAVKLDDLDFNPDKLWAPTAKMAKKP